MFVGCAPLSCSVEDGLPIKGRPFKEGSVIVVSWHLLASCHLVTVTSWDVWRLDVTGKLWVLCLQAALVYLFVCKAAMVQVADDTWNLHGIGKAHGGQVTRLPLIRPYACKTLKVCFKTTEMHNTTRTLYIFVPRLPGSWFVLLDCPSRLPPVEWNMWGTRQSECMYVQTLLDQSGFTVTGKLYRW